ncbi:MAG: GGDEF domain-containing protein [Candidatus Omnitrophota bacterium]
MVKKCIIGLNIPQDIYKELLAHFDLEVYELLNFSFVQELIRNVTEYQYKVGLIFIYTDLEYCQELCVLLRDKPHLETVPIILISHREENQAEKIQLLKSGLIDIYVSSYTSAEELIAYSSILLQRQILEEELELKNQLLKELSFTDELTRLYNRRYMLESLEQELKKIKRYCYPLSCLMFDIDYFKKINDGFGHSQGDLVLVGLAEIVRKNIRSSDIACRYGGDEIVVILPFTDFQNAFLIANKLHEKVGDYNFGTKDKPLKFTISVGLVSLDGQDGVEVDTLFLYLDKQLYEAKNKGRNRVCGGLYKDLARKDAV